MIRFSIKTIDINEIYYLFFIIIIFFLSIFKELRDFLHFIIIEDALFDKKQLFNFEFSSISFIDFSIYREIKCYLYFILLIKIY